MKLTIIYESTSTDIVRKEDGRARFERETTEGRDSRRNGWRVERRRGRRRYTSRCVIALDPGTVAALRAQPARQAEGKLAIGSRYLDQQLVFADVAGSRCIRAR